MGLWVTLSPAVPWAVSERTSLPRMWRGWDPGSLKSAAPGLRSQLGLYFAVLTLAKFQGSPVPPP